MTWWTQKSMEMSVLLLMMWKMGRSGKIWKCSAWYARGSEKDFLSGDWMFGRGTADMKGGLSVGLALLDWYGKLVVEAERKECGTAAFETKTASGTEETPEISGNLLFVTVPDEEGYSAGMRHAVPF